MAQTQTVNYRITFAEFFAMLFFAIFFDLLSVIPGIGIVGQIMFGAYFYINGVKVLSWKGGKFAVSGVSAFVEALPVLSAFPTVITFVGVHTFVSRAEDKVKSMAAPAPKKAREKPDSNEPEPNPI